MVHLLKEYSKPVEGEDMQKWGSMEMHLFKFEAVWTQIHLGDWICEIFHLARESYSSRWTMRELCWGICHDIELLFALMGTCITGGLCSLSLMPLFKYFV